MWQVMRRHRSLVVGALAAGIAFAILILYGMRAGKPVINDPVAVSVQRGGQSLVVIIDRCMELQVTEVRITAEPRNEDAGAQTVLWDYYTPRGASHFSTASTADGNVRTRYTGLGSVHSGDQLVARVYYERESAPKRLRDRDNLFTVFTAVQSSSQIKKFKDINSRSENC